MKSKDNAVTRNPNIAWQKVEEKAVLVSPQTKKIHVLHGCGGRIWDYLKETRCIDDLVTLICDEYDASPDSVKKDVEVFLAQLELESLVLQQE